MTWGEIPPEVRKWVGIGLGLGAFALSATGTVAWAGGEARSDEPDSRIEAVERVNARQDSAIGRLERSDEAQARADSLQNSMLEALSCSWLSDIGLEQRTPRECARDYLRRR